MKKAAIIGFVLCALGAINPLWATIFPAPGGSGDHSVEARCKPSEKDYLVGFAFRTGDWMDQIQPLCARLISADQLGGRRYLKVRGGNGGSQGEQYCKNNEVITQITPIMREGGVLKALDFVCTPIDSGMAHTISIGPHHQVGVWAGADPQVCPAGEVSSGIQVRYGKYVNAIGLICDPFKVPLDKQATCLHRCGPLLTNVHPPAEADRVNRNCLALCNYGADAVLTCPDHTTVKGTAPCK
jgi:hypothetical protein